MRIRRVDRKIEKDILIGMITDKSFLSQIRPVITPSTFKNPYCRTVAKWIINFYDKFDDAPFNEIQKIYDYHEREGEIEEDETDPIKTLLEDAAEQYAETPNFNCDFLLNKAQEYFNRINLERNCQEIQDLLEQGDVSGAQNVASQIKEIRIGDRVGTDGLVDQAELEAAFSETSKPMFHLPGAIGKMINSELCRDHFLVLQAPEKTGKTWWLLWMALRALKKRLRVVMFELEMTKNQVNRRLSISISGKSDQHRYCDGKNIPKRFIPGDEAITGLPEGVTIERIDEGSYEPLDWRVALQENEAFYKRFRLQKDKHWRLITVPARSINCRQIGAELARLEKEENFIADVVLIDYMDILAPENPREQDRERINSNWVAAKALCNERHLLLISCTQANSMSYGVDFQTRANFSEDHRKYAHTNGTLGLTQTGTDKKNGIAKLNWLVLREGDYSENDLCFIVQCLKKGRFCVDSFFKEDFEREHDVTLGNIVKPGAVTAKEKKKYKKKDDDEDEDIQIRKVNKKQRTTRC